MGLPCPNLGTGGHAYHGPYEHITVEGVNIAVDVGLKIIEFQVLDLYIQPESWLKLVISIVLIIRLHSTCKQIPHARKAQENHVQILSE